MGDFEETYRPDDDAAILEAFRTFDEGRFTQHAAAVALEKGVSIDEVKQRAKFLHKRWKKEKARMNSGNESRSSAKGRSVARQVDEGNMAKEPNRKSQGSGKHIRNEACVAKWGGKEPRSVSTPREENDARDEPSIPRKKVEDTCTKRKSPELIKDSDGAPVPRKKSKETERRSSPRNEKRTSPDRFVPDTGKPRIPRVKAKEPNASPESNRSRSVARRKKPKQPRRNSEKSSSESSKLNELEIEFAWLVEESIICDKNPRLKFWFVELHASNELKEWIDQKKAMQSNWKKAGKISAMIKGSKMDAFNLLREKIQRDLRNGTRREVTKDHLPKPGEEPRSDDDESYESGSPTVVRKCSKMGRTKIMDIKPRHEIGDRVYAGWLHDPKQSPDEPPKFFSGTVHDFQVTQKHGPYGEGRVYDILFDDGDRDPHLEDFYVFSEKDWILITKHDLPRDGVTEHRGEGDKYAEEVGWYRTRYTGDKAFANLSDAVKAHDEAVVKEKQGKEEVKKTDLLYPKDWQFSIPGTNAPVYVEAPVIDDLPDDPSEDDDDIIKEALTQPMSPPKKHRKKIDRSRSKRKADSDISVDLHATLVDTPEAEVLDDRESSNLKRRKSGRASKAASGNKTKCRVVEDNSVSKDDHASNEADGESLRIDIAVAHRLTAKFGMDMLAWNRISARFGSGFLASPARKIASMIKPDDIVLLSDVAVDVTHEAIYNARPDVKAIVHLQSPAATSISCLRDNFQFLTPDSAHFYKKLATYSAPRRRDKESKKRAIMDAVASVKGCNTLIMHNHGFLCFGTSVREAWVLAWHFERCCEVQLNVMKSGGEVRELSEEDIAEATEASFNPESAPGSEWDGLAELVSFD